MKLPEYKPRPPIQTIAAIVFFCLLAVRLALLALGLFAGLTLIGKVSVYFINLLLLVSALFAIKKNRILLYSITAVLILVNTVLLLLGNDRAEYYFSSPAGQNTLIIQEQSALISSGWASVYRKEYGIFKRRLPYNIGTDDNYQPFPQGKYRLEWPDEQTVLLSYYNGRYEQLEIKLA